MPMQNTPPWEKGGLLLRRTWKISLLGVIGIQYILGKNWWEIRFLDQVKWDIEEENH